MEPLDLFVPHKVSHYKCCGYVQLPINTNHIVGEEHVLLLLFSIDAIVICLIR